MNEEELVALSRERDALKARVKRVKQLELGYDELRTVCNRLSAERDALREKLRMIEELGGKTILGPTDEECAEAKCEPNLRWAHSVGANKAFNQAAEIARFLRGALPTATPCRIHEHDGAYKCYAHNKMWGAVSRPDEPCAGWSSAQGEKGSESVSGTDAGANTLSGTRQY